MKINMFYIDLLSINQGAKENFSISEMPLLSADRYFTVA